MDQKNLDCELHRSDIRKDYAILDVWYVFAFYLSSAWDIPLKVRCIASKV